MKKIILLLLFIAILSCSTKRYVYHGGYYTISLSDVENGIGEKNINQLHYEDDLINISWKIALSNFGFEVANKSSGAIKIVWDEAVYVDTDGTSNKVMHSGVKYTEANNHQPPTVIVGGSKIEDIILPTKNIYYETNPYMSGWKERHILPTTDMDSLRIAKTGDMLIGKNIKILLPIEQGDKKNNYTFVFKIDNFTMVE